MGDPSINDADQTLLIMDHPCCGQVDTTLLLLDNLEVLAEVHCLCLLNCKDCLATITELQHYLDTPLKPI